MPRRSSASSQTRSSSARPTTMARTPSSMTSLRVTTSPVTLRPAGQDDVEALVEHDLLAALELLDVDVGVEGDPHLAAARQHVDRAVVVLADDDAVGRRRLGELVDLVAQGGDVLAGLPQRVGELLVLGDGLGELALGLEQPLLERAHPLGGVGQLPAQCDDLFLEHLDVLAQVSELGLVGLPPCGLVGHADHPLPYSAPVRRAAAHVAARATANLTRIPAHAKGRTVFVFTASAVYIGTSAAAGAASHDRQASRKALP